MGDKNVECYRYTKSKQNTNEIKIKKIFILQEYHNFVYAALTNFPYSYAKELVDFRVNYLLDIKRFSKPEIIKNPKNNSKNIFNTNMIYLGNIEVQKLKNSIIIVDWIAHTFFYEAIQRKIPIILFFNRKWLSHFTSNYLEILKIFESENLFYFWDQKELFLKS